MGESASVRTQRELAELRRAIDRDVAALIGRAREDVDPRRLARRNPVAVAGSLGSIALAAGVAFARKLRERRGMEGQVDVLIESFGGRISKLRGKARKRFRQELKKEMAEVRPAGPRELAWGVVAAALTALATSLARGFGRRLLGDEAERTRR